MDYATLQGNSNRQEKRNLSRRKDMDRNHLIITHLRRTKLLFLLCALWVLTTNMRAQYSRLYSESEPLLIACDWDFAPYEFAHDGQATGFHVDVLKAILKELNIPYKFVMNTRIQGVKAFKEKKADLIFDYRSRFANDSNSYTSRSTFHYYSLELATRQDTPPIRSINQLKGTDVVIMNNNHDSLTAHLIFQTVPNLNIEYHSVREALAGVSNGSFKYFIWSEAPLKWKINELGTNNIVIYDLNLPKHEVHLVGHDSLLIDNIDALYARMLQNGDIEYLNTKWFHPEDLPQHSSPKVLYLTLVILLITIIAYALYRLTKSRVKAAIRRNEDTETMMHLALNTSDYSVLILNLKDMHLRNYHGNILPPEGMSREEFRQHIHPNDRDIIRQIGKDLVSGKRQVAEISLRWNPRKDGIPVWRDIQGHAFTESDSNGHARNIVLSVRDMTISLKKERAEREMGARFKKMFESTLLAMSFYDKEGHLIDLNDNMRKMCCPDEESERFYREMNLYDVDLLKGDYDFNSHEHFHICQHMYYPKANTDIYIEFRLRPIYNEADELIYYTITARDITNERNTYLTLREHKKALQQTNAINSTYENRLRILMESCQMYVWHYDIKTQLLIFSQSQHSEKFFETLEEYVNSMFEDEREAAIEHTKQVLEKKMSFNVVHHYRHTPVSNEPRWFATSGMPTLDDNGNIIGLFGIVRDVSDLMENLEKLKKETARAEDSGRQKSAFLANMTHEIRTPLNAIVGFSDLLHDIDAPEERKEFIRIIRNNCDMLLRLINDIIEASTLDTNPIVINPVETDFSKAFDDICQSLAQRVTESGVQFITENPYTTFQTVIDEGRIQQVMTNFVTNAVKYTHEGHIRIGYRYENDGIYVFCEDTGVGIPKEKQSTVFERFVKLNDFVQGTGLGLSICKSIADRCGGRIGVESEGEGKGSTFWMWLPCQVITMTPNPK